jgi:hypothetical protein
VRKGSRVPRIDELTEHLVLGNELRGQRCGKQEEVAQQGRLRNGLKLQDVARQHGLDQRVANVGAP